MKPHIRKSNGFAGSHRRHLYSSLFVEHHRCKANYLSPAFTLLINLYLNEAERVAVMVYERLHQCNITLNGNCQNIKGPQAPMRLSSYDPHGIRLCLKSNKPLFHRPRCVTECILTSLLVRLPEFLKVLIAGEFSDVEGQHSKAGCCRFKLLNDRLRWLFTRCKGCNVARKAQPEPI
jgi:hypothetical protein